MMKSTIIADEQKSREQLIRELQELRRKLAGSPPAEGRESGNTGAPSNENGFSLDVISYLPAAVCTCDAEGRITWFNRRAAELWGREPDLGVGGQKFCGAFRLYRTDGRPLPHDQAPMADTIREGRSTHGQEVIVERPDGTRVVISVFIDPLRDADGRRIGAINVFQDVTGYRRVVEALTEAMETAKRRAIELDAALESIAEGVLLCDRRGAILRLNGAAQEILRYTPQERSLPYEQRVRLLKARTPDGRDAAPEDLPMARTLRGETVRAQVLAFSHNRTGPPCWVSVSTSPIRDAGGRVSGIIATLSDVTRQRDLTAQREKLLADLQSEQCKLRAILSGMQEGLLATDARGRVLFYNPALLRMHDCDSRSLPPTLLKRMLDGWQIQDLEGRTLPPEEWPVNRAAHGERFSGLEVLISHPETGRSYIGSCNGTPVPDGEGNPRFGLVTIRNITARKKIEQALQESEERFRTLADMVPDIIFTSTPDGWSEYLNHRFYELTGLKHEEVAGYGWLTTVHPEDIAVVLAGWKEATAEGRPWECRFRMRTADGSHRWMIGRALPLRDANGRVDKWLGVNTDIEELVRDQESLRETEQALRELTETLEKKVAERTALSEQRARQLQALAVQLIEAEERERGRIAAILHDDLQQILAGARMQLQSIPRDRLEEGALRTVEQLLEESIRKSRNLSHELSPTVLHHADLLQSLEWLARQMMVQHGLAVRLEAEEVPPEGAEAGPLKVFLFRAVQELLFNVVKHSGVKSARLRLRRLSDQMQVTVSDRGRGFDPAVLTCDGTDTSGFGLVSIRERTRSVGGSLRVDSRAGRGSRFTLTVPCSLSEAPGAATVRRAGTAAVPRSRIRKERVPAGAQHRVLFVDDHKVLRQGLISMIQGQPDISVVGEASDGFEAVEMARELRPDVIVMDVSMPEMDGIEATRRIKRELPEIRIIGLSMIDEPSVEEAMRHAGAEAFVCKTDSSRNLLKAIYGMPASS